ncbi:superoxide dismutase [Vibrio mimicus]|nr:superoxide dismutase [Vibrio mimicus]KAA3490824.1 superoxide dismutase [Vibrio mimicus]
MEPQWLWLLCLSLVLMRCQPLRRALVFLGVTQISFLKENYENFLIFVYFQ